jgi:DNA primase
LTKTFHKFVWQKATPLKLSQKTISDVQNRINIEEVVSDFVTLKRRGQNLIACCPFHEEKTPSFSVSPGKGIFKCFGCGKVGDAISFVMEIEGTGFNEAIRYLAKKYGIDVVEEQQLGEEELVKQNERESIYIVLNYAKEHYRKILWEHEDGMTIGLSYFKERGFDHHTIKKFELGFSLDKWDNFYTTAIKEGHSLDLLEKAGLIIRKEQKVFDRFRGRVMFPIHNVSGKVIAFGARVLKHDQQPKYLNSPETDVYHKSKVLYGIHQAKQAIRQHDNCYLVEGYTDVISLHLSGVENVVASSGTSLTDEQISLIGRYTQNITVLYDGDAAGIRASLRGIDMILEKGLNVKVVVFPDGEDPDSYSRKVGSNDFQKYLAANSTDFIVFKVNLFSKDAGNDPIKKSEYIKEIVSSIVKIPEPLKRAVYVKECSAILDMDESVLLAELNKILIRNNREKRKQKSEEEPIPDAPLMQEKEYLLSAEDIIALQERESIRLLISYGANELVEEYQLYHYLLDELEGIEFISPVYKEILKIFKYQLSQGKVIDADYLKNNASEQIKNTVIDMISEKYEISENWEEKYKIYVPSEAENLQNLALTNILRLKVRIVRKLIQENMEKLKTAETSREQDNFIMNHAELKKMEMELAGALGNVVIR